jgi:glutamate-1-semialdehyde 2,1-aminomutase
MAELAPLGPVYQAGTLSGNPAAMAAGLATLTVLERENAWQRLEELGQELAAQLAPVLAELPLPATLVRLGSIFWLSLQEGAPPRTAEAIDPAAAERYRELFHGLLERGISIAPSAFEVGFLSLAHRSEHLSHFARRLAEAGAALATPAGR